MSYLWPATQPDGGGRHRIPLIVLTVINVIGVKSGVSTAVFLSISKTLPLLLYIAAGVFAFSGAVFAEAGRAPRSGTWGEAALLLLFAYAGFENTAAPAGEFKNPRRDVPFALIAQIVIVTLIYSRCGGDWDVPASRLGDAAPSGDSSWWLGRGRLLRRVVSISAETNPALRPALNIRARRTDSAPRPSLPSTRA